MGVLQDILSSKRQELPELRRRPLPSPPSLRPFGLRRAPTAPLHLICEIKRRSPSAGRLSTRLSVEQRAAAYEAGGASMISVLCDGPYFDGSYDDLARVRSACDLPLLCKEFILDEVQLDAARAYGASAVLLIVRCLDDGELGRLVAAARQRELLPLVEVHGAAELQRALDAGADFVGVNSRDLDTLKMDSQEAERVVQGIPQICTAAHLSGIKTPSDVVRVARGRADCALIGEVLMREDDPAAHLQALVEAASVQAAQCRSASPAFDDEA